MKYGVKLWSINSDLYSEFVDNFKLGQVDYLELLYVPGKIKGLQCLIDNSIPVVVHAPTFNQKILFADDNVEQNRKTIIETIDFANSVNSKEIIIHPDIGDSEKFKDLLYKFKKYDLIIENMPRQALDGQTCIGYTKEEIKDFLDIGNFNFCLDVGHAIKSAISQNINYKQFLKDMIKLKPKIIHICDGHLNVEKDEHLNLGDGDFDLKFVSKIISESNTKKITFEVPKNDGLKNDIKNIDFFKSHLE